MSSQLIAPEHYRKGWPNIDYRARTRWMSHKTRDGHTQKEVADALGVKPQVVCSALRRLEGRPKASKPRLEKSVRRLCMTCDAHFWSEGPHNRMCERCRQRKSDPFSWR